MSESKQRIGDITGSARVSISQTGTGAVDQAVGNVSGAIDVKLSQTALAGQGDMLRELETLIERLPDEDSRAALSIEVRELLHHEAPGAVIPKKALMDVQDALPPGAIGPRLANAVRDLSSAASLISGGIAISQISDPYLLAIAVPATLVATGLMQAERLTALYDRIRQLLSRR